MGKNNKQDEILDLRDRAERALDIVLSFYETQGVPLSYRPKLGYISKDPENFPYLMIANVEYEIREKNFDFFNGRFTKIIWKDLHKLEVSEEAIEELCDVTARLQKEMVEDPELDDILTFEYAFGEDNVENADIVLFESCRDLDKKEMVEVLLHEVWHLIEKERGLMDQTPLIMEGTAMYVSRRAFEKRFDTTIESGEDILESIYLGGAALVKEHVEKFENPYIALLDETLREEIHNEVIERLEPVIGEKSRMLYENEEFMEHVSDVLKKPPLYQELIGNVTPTSVLNFYKKIGANKLVEEIKDQDISLLVYDFKRKLSSD